MANLNIAIKIAAQDRASGPISRITGSLGGLGQAGDTAARGLGKVAQFAGGVAIAGIEGLVAGIGAVGTAGFLMNNQMEQASATINAFTKDTDETARILAMVEERAKKTPFAFNEMATAAAGLIPAANQAGVELESLIQDAEILAAANPAEGLEGAAFALREAVSGDFTSIIERFNLPRSYINQLKEEGVPALEIVRKAMAEMGYDTDLVSALANTAQGRWSTFKDTLQSLAATATAPFFDRLSTALGELNAKLEENGPAMEQFAENFGTQALARVDQFTISIEDYKGRINTAFAELGAAFNVDTSGLDALNTSMAILNLILTPIELQIRQITETMEGLVDLIGVVQNFAGTLKEMDTSGLVSAITNQASAYHAVTSPSGLVRQDIRIWLRN